MELRGDKQHYARFLEEWCDKKAYIIAHTSGSTGVPKEILLSKDEMLASAQSTNKFFQINSDSILYSPLSVDYIAGKMMLVRAWAANCDLYVEEPSNKPLHSVNLFPITKIDLLPVVPSQIEGLISNLQRHSTVEIKNLIIGGAAINSQAELNLLKQNVKSYATYGMTETCSHVALRELGASCYIALPGINFTADERSCLVIHWNNIDRKPLVTNDVVELNSPISFNWLSRFDNVINTGGLKVFPEKLEEKISSFLHVPFYISSEPDEKWGEAVALYFLDKSNEVNEKELKTQLSNCLKQYEMPKIFKRIKEMPLTKNGKIKRKRNFL